MIGVHDAAGAELIVGDTVTHRDVRDLFGTVNRPMGHSVDDEAPLVEVHWRQGPRFPHERWVTVRADHLLAVEAGHVAR